MAASVAPPQTSLAIVINMQYTDEGDPAPHDENPSWDPSGLILKAHFQSAKTIWERLLPGDEEYTFDFHWDDDIAGLGLASESGFDTFVEINPSYNWFADPTPGDDSEFSAGTQTLFRQLSAPNQSTYFPGTAPPGTLEVGFRGTGIASTGTLITLSASGQTIAGPSGLVPVDSSNGYDLLSTIVHELGHILGITAEPGEFNIDPQHVGGLENVLVLEDSDGGHLAGQGIVPFLMCESCGVPGVRRFPTATDVLVIAEDQGLDTVHLDRVDRISNGLWSDVDGWIGGAVPDETQDVSIRHGGTVSLDENSQVKSVLVKTGTSLSLGNHQLAAKETMDFENTIVNIADGGAIAANNIIADPNSIVTTQGSLVQFNRFTRTPSSTATLAIFNGNVAVGYHTGSDNPVAVTFDPNPISTWNIGGDLTVGHATNTTLEVNNGTWTVGGSASVGGILGKGGGITITNGGRLTVGGNLDVRGSQQQTSRIAVVSNSRLDVVGTLSVGSQGIVEFENAAAPAITSLELEGGDTIVRGGPWPTPFYLERTSGGRLTFDNTNFRAAGAIVHLEGGAGDGAPGSLLTLKANFRADGVQIHNGPGRKGPSLPNGTIQYYQAGFGGETRFEGHASAGTSSIHNEGVTEDYYGTGGRTIFTGDSRAGSATVENFGSTLRTYLAPTAGGATEFRDRASADEATLTNHFGGLAFGFSGAGHTIFYDQSTADRATLINISGNYERPWAGETEFRGSSTAANAKIFNRGSPTGHSHGLTSFFDNATAGSATITLNFGPGGGGLTEFNGNSNAGTATVMIEGRGAAPSGWGGRVTFNDNSSAANAHFTIGPEVRFSSIWFDDQSSAGNATFVMQDDSHAYMDFFGHSSAGNARFDIGRYSTLWIDDDATAANANITVHSNGTAAARGYSTPGGNPTVTLGSAQIQVLGANAPVGTGYYGGTLSLNHFVGAGEATIVVEGGAVANALGGTINNHGRLDSATLIVNGGVAGAYGGTASFYGGGNGVNARVVSNGNANISVYSDAGSHGDTVFGSIEGTGSFGIADAAHLITGGLNTDTTVSGPITHVSGHGINGGRLTKIGTGTLTIAGINTYKGLTTINAGTLCLTGSLAGNTVVNSGGTLKGNGTIRGTVTVNSGGVFATGALPGVFTVGGLNILPGGILDLEQGALAIAPNGGSAGTSIVDAIVIQGTSQLELNNNDLVVRATAATKDAVHTAVQAKIVSAQNGLDANLVTKWDGPGVTSTTARTANVAAGFDLVGLGVIRNSDLDVTTGIPNSSYPSFSGQAVTPNDILVKHTYIGDANLNGAVSFDDYVGMDNAFFELIPNLGWATGDINFDGVINFDDYSKVDQAFFFQAASLSDDGAVTVPEPATVFLIALGLMATIALTRHCPANRAKSAKN